ncbi:MAG: VCBS repeat-containing protein, partial [Candidatus Riflebacteria bacterium]|nr:VCBS repeat-containing protein [Candidatus Riflebacteria bacterium]
GYTYNPAFRARGNVATGTGPRSIALSDFNGDGKPDMAVANQTSNNVSVMLNTMSPGATSPSYSGKVDFTAGNAPFGVTAADVNRDGKPDLMVVNKNSATVSVMLNVTAPGASAPTFTTKTDWAVVSGPGAVAAADLNNDGTPDMLTVGETSNYLYVRMNWTACGSFTQNFSTTGWVSTPSAPVALVVADLNGDGKVDAAAASNGGNCVSVFLNNTPTGGAPAFQARYDCAVDIRPEGLAVADLNGDGKPDLVSSNSQNANLSVLLNATAPGSSSPSFRAAVHYATGSSPLRSGRPRRRRPDRRRQAGRDVRQQGGELRLGLLELLPHGGLPCVAGREARLQHRQPAHGRGAPRPQRRRQAGPGGGAGLRARPGHGDDQHHHPGRPDLRLRHADRLYRHQQRRGAGRGRLRLRRPAGPGLCRLRGQPGVVPGEPDRLRQQHPGVRRGHVGRRGGGPTGGDRR